MAFRILDFSERTFQLKVGGNHYRWKITTEARPGLAILFKTDKSLPQNEEEAEKFEDSHSAKEVQDMYDNLENQAMKNILSLNSLVEPLDDPPISGLDQLEFFALCLEGNDPAKVYAFFLISSVDSIKFQEEINQRIDEILKDHPEIRKEAEKNRSKSPSPGN